jgi:ABC-type Fe3+/spermidine/putrescine transport system ATPase subunit
LVKNSGIQVKNLVKSFQKGTVLACKNVNLDVAEGELMVLLGPSGCGKTTTLRCIAGLESPDNDDAIWIKGRNVTRLPPKDRNLAFVFQDITLFPILTCGKISPLDWTCVKPAAGRKLTDGFGKRPDSFISKSFWIENPTSFLEGRLSA